jgi:putative oxidoreductase
MLRKLIQTENGIDVFIIRLLLGIVFFPHGMQKVPGWFGGHGFEDTMKAFTGGMGIPAFLAFLAIMAEFMGSLGLITGFLTRVAAFGIACNMLVAVAMIHYKYGFFMNWFGKQAGEGFEYHVLVIAIAIALMIKGGGKWSVDRSLWERMRTR